MSKFIFLLFLSFNSLAFFAQAPRTYTPPSNTRGDNQGTSNNVTKEIPFVKYYTIDKKENVTEFADTSLANFEIYAPHRSFEDGALILGNLGSSSRHIIYQDNRDIFTDMGFNQYNIYRIEKNDFRYYRLNRPHNDLFFSPRSGQQDFMVHAKFSRNLDNNMNLAIDFERIKQEGLYQNQETKMTRFGVGLSKRTESHELYLLFLANNFNEAHNGGVTENIDSINNDPNSRINRAAIPTFTNSASGRHQYFSYSVDNFWHLQKTKFSVHHSLRMEQGYFRFSDENTDSSNDSLLYKSYLTNTRGLRSVNQFTRWSNTIDLALKISEIKMVVGLDYRYLKYKDELATDNVHDLGLFGDIEFQHKKLGKISARAEFGVGENVGNLLLTSNINFNATQNINFYAQASTKRYDAFLNQRRFVVTETPIFVNSFDKITELNILGGMHLTKVKLNISFESGLIDKAVYYNENALPIQNSGSIEYLQLKLKHNLFWKFIGLENELIYQKFSNNIYHLPTIYSRHNAYLQARLFKKRLQSRLGLQYYFINYDGALAFMPVNGAFYAIDQETENYPITEVYANFQVDEFRIFFRIDNFTDLIKPEVHYQIVNHLQLDSKFRMGVRWMFSD